MGALKSSGADPSPSRLELAMVRVGRAWAQGGAFRRIVASERDTVNQETLDIFRD